MYSTQGSRIACDARAVPPGSPSLYSNYVGRVAGLAVALGVGAAIASIPAVAFADPTDSASSTSSSSSSGAGAASGDSSADSSASDSTHETRSSSPGGPSFGSGSDAESDAESDVAADVTDVDIAEADIADVDIEADDPADATTDTPDSESSNADDAIPDISAFDDSASDGGTLATDSTPLNVAAPDATRGLDEQTSDDDPGTPVADPSDGPAATYARREVSDSDNTSWAVGQTDATQSGEPFVADAATSDAASASGSTAVGSAVSAEADAGRLFGDGTAEHPNGGSLFGSGFSWDADSCASSTACDGGDAGLWGGSGGDGFNGGNGGSAGWFGSGGDGGAGIPGGNGGNGGRGGLIFGAGGNGGTGGAALVAAGAPGLGGDGGDGGLFGTDGRVGNLGAAFPGETPPDVGAPSLDFEFIYGTGAQHWSSAARDALEAAALSLSSYFVVTSPVTLTYDISGEYSPFSSTLAWSSSALSGASSGFLNTVVQEKIQSGVDTNGDTADGTVNFNFGPSWGLGNSVGNSQYDFQSTAIHELLHTFGLISFVDTAGSNSSRNWTVYDGFIVTSGNADVIGDDFRWNSAYNSNLTGGNGGLYFGGPDAVAAYGGLVPLYTPNPWKSGSSVTHLDDASFTGSNTQLIDALSQRGLGIRTLSPIELGILSDLGYAVVSPQETYAALFFTIFFLRRRKAASLGSLRDQD